MLKRLYNKLLKNPTTEAETTETGTRYFQFPFHPFNLPFCYQSVSRLAHAQ